MSRSSDRLELARIAAIQSRARLTGTMIALQARLRPGALLEDALVDLREKTTELSKDAVDIAKARPDIVAGVIATLLIILFRIPLLNAAMSGIAHIAKTFQKDGAVAPAPSEDRS